MILITAALKDELHPYFEDLDVLYTGIGKINATYALTRALKNSETELVLNFGTAASSTHSKGSIIQVDRFYERDMKCEVIEFKAENPDYLSANQGLMKNRIAFAYPQAACFTGDSFLHYFQCQEYIGVIDMEAFALAKVCWKIGIPFMSFKSVTDGFSNNSVNDWRDNLKLSALHFRKIYDIIINKEIY
jgi:adenosylhomocysteine nucleosidase